MGFRWGEWAFLLEVPEFCNVIANHDLQDWHSDNEGGRRPRSSIELPPIHLSTADVTSAPLPSLESARQRDLLPSIMSHSPPGRSSTLPPLHRPMGSSRPRKQSISKRGHHRKKSRGPPGPGADWLRRIQNDGPDLLRPGSFDRKALSAEPSGDYGKRWEDLIDAAASATEDIDEDRTPVSLKFPSMLDPRLTSQVPQSPISIPRASLPPYPQNAFTGSSYQASPLQQALTPPPRTTQTLPSRSRRSRAAKAERISTLSPGGCRTRRPATRRKTRRFTAPRARASRC